MLFRNSLLELIKNVLKIYFAQQESLIKDNSLDSNPRLTKQKTTTTMLN